jgi:hypothetical protein
MPLPKFTNLCIIVGILISNMTSLSIYSQIVQRDEFLSIGDSTTLIS